MIEFTHECWAPFDLVRITANEDGTEMVIMDEASGKQIDLADLSSSDRDRIMATIKNMVLEWRDHADAMASMPYNEYQDKGYVDQLNKERR